MSNCSSDSGISSVAAVRRERLSSHVTRAGLGSLRICNSMQELYAIASLGKQGRDVRAELVSSLAAARERLPSPQESAGDAAPAKSVVSPIAKAENRQPSPAVHPPMPTQSLFESTLQTTGRVVRERT